MKNLQVIEKVQHDDGSVLDVVGIWNTIQGEGPYAGRPAVFVRLAGCNYKCPQCDTDYTSGRKERHYTDVVEDIKHESFAYLKRRFDLVVITGGEPLRQNIMPLLNELAVQGYTTQIETNGTIFHTAATSACCVVCSPKGQVARDLKPHIHALKYVVSSDNVDDDGLPKSVLGLSSPPERPWSGFDGIVYVQPADEGDEEKNKRNLDTAVQSAMRHGYTLSLQMHKIIGVR